MARKGRLRLQPPRPPYSRWEWGPDISVAELTQQGGARSAGLSANLLATKLAREGFVHKAPLLCNTAVP
jgi:hypothetical protein